MHGHPGPVRTADHEMKQEVAERVRPPALAHTAARSLFQGEPAERVALTTDEAHTQRRVSIASRVEAADGYRFLIPCLDLFPVPLNLS